MKSQMLILILSALLASNASTSRDLSAYKYCHAKYQILQAQHLNLNRLERTIGFHQKAFSKYKQSKNENLANFHKQHHNYMTVIFKTKKDEYNTEISNYEVECEKDDGQETIDFDHQSGYRLINV